MPELKTNMNSAWIDKVVRDNPFTLLENGNIRTCPLRLSFFHGWKRAKPQKGDDGQLKEGKYGSVLIIPPSADVSLLGTIVRDTALAKWPRAGQPDGPRLKPTPLHPQSEMAGRYDGFWNEGIFIRAIADRQPPIVDQRNAPITDENRAYSGAWAIVAIRAFTYDLAMSKGVSFGLQSVMIIADDQQLSGGGGNPAQDFAGVNISSDVNPAAAFGTGATAGQQGGAPGVVDIFA